MTLYKQNILNFLLVFRLRKKEKSAFPRELCGITVALVNQWI